jgi:hypothetical protein
MNAHGILVVVGDILLVVTAASFILYAPFARSWRRALGVPFAIAFIWGALRAGTIVVFGEPSPPLIGFVALPFFCALYAAAARLFGKLLKQIPFVRGVTERFRAQWVRK